MTAIEPADRHLLDFLCAVEANRHCRITSVRTRLRPSLRRLRYAGLVWFDGFTPSASAMADWRARMLKESPTPPGGAPVEEPPTPTAADAEGGAAARSVAAPPTSKTFPCGCPRTPDNTKLDHGKWARCRKCTNERHRLAQKERRQRERIDRGPKPDRRKSPTETDGLRRAARLRRQITRKALQRIEQGLDARTATQACIRHAQFALERELEISARMADPVEQAKASLRKRYTPVVSMSVYGGAADRFMVGSRKDLTQDELLAMAGKVAA